MTLPTSPEQTCRACQAPIVFAFTGGRKGGSLVRMPVDPAPSPEGNLLITANGGAYHARTLSGEELAALRGAGQALYVSHFATCSAPDRFRRGRGRGAESGEQGGNRVDRDRA